MIATAIAPHPLPQRLYPRTVEPSTYRHTLTLTRVSPDSGNHQIFFSALYWM